jgi:glutamate/tyrosine decarboxylase-like PLP-dependent enzyme
VGWKPADYQAWSDAEQRAGRSFVVPTSWHGEVVMRMCIVNPRTTVDDIESILTTLEDPSA